MLKAHISCGGSALLLQQLACALPFRKPFQEGFSYYMVGWLYQAAAKVQALLMATNPKSLGFGYCSCDETTERQQLC